MSEPAIATREPIKPTVDIPLSTAVEELTGFEVIAIERKWGRPLEQLAGLSLLMGVVWAYENRDGNKREWASVQGMTVRELNGYFEPEPVEDEGETGKGSEPAATPIDV